MSDLDLMLEDSYQSMRDFCCGVSQFDAGEFKSIRLWAICSEPLQGVCRYCGTITDTEDNDDYINLCKRCDDQLWYQASFTNYFNIELLEQSVAEGTETPFAICSDCGELLYDSEPVYYGRHRESAVFTNNIGVLCLDCAEKYDKCNYCLDYFPKEEVEYVCVNGKHRPYCFDCREEHIHECDDCGEINDEDEMSEIDGDWVCDSCKDDDYFFCEICNEWHKNSERNSVRRNDIDGTIEVCDDCFSDSSYIEGCNRCGEAFYTYFQGLENVETECGTEGWCQDCIDYDAYRNENNETYCQTGYCPPPNNIWGYHDYPDDWVFCQTDKDKGASTGKTLYMGVELEIDEGGEDWDNAISITNYMGFPCDESTDLKVSHDGSLDNGFEIITMPCSLNYHKTQINWKDGMQRALELDYKSHDAGTCGLHVHVNRSYFETPRDKHIAEKKLSLVVQNNKEWLKTFSRRKNFEYCEFKGGNEPFVVSDFADSEHRINAPERLQTLVDAYNGHYSAVNFANDDTIEFRFFRGTLIPQTFYASLELVQMICDCVKRFSYIQLCYLDFKFFYNMAIKRGYQNFIAYAKERGLTMLPNNRQQNVA